MNLERTAGAFCIFLPLAFNAFFFLLGRRFDYPDILRRPTEEILSRFQAGGVTLKLLWYGLMLTAALLAPLAVLLGQVLARDGLNVLPVATTIGVLAAVVQFLGLARWPFLVPGLARAYADPASSQGTREATRVAFEAFHRYLGVWASREPQPGAPICCKQVNSKLPSYLPPPRRRLQERLQRLSASESLQRQTPRFRGVYGADDGTRTHDLLHGKQTL